ncbi:AAA family ATPase [Salisediminibacterium halotolerans]|uniref:AAA+-type ATPase, SpoVK/Ycf46/Vps4 family n=1 Tax=Salisediminibacterium halotolerans TaxID=517425 RepID=A0A1H9RW78_9BACI|nr:AAA family ATPase [Salisediminibacterium haloalkalitolerans]SER76996.1 AAA+-type ATPase, SpoVK/Ycf46/Vps4 family [Salisediminibacterium haloalkalitolerans]
MEHREKPEQPFSEKIEELRRTSFSRLNEARLVRLYEQAAGSALSQEEEADLQAMMAAARFERKKAWDVRVNQWLRSAVAADPSPYVKNTLEYLIAALMDEPWFTADIPKIRETDHSQGKKTKTETVISLMKEANERYHKLQGIFSMLQAFQAPSSATIRQADDLLKEIGALLNRVIDDARAYETTISGIYASKEKKQQFDESLATLFHYTEQWEAMRETSSESPHSPLRDLQRMVGLEEVKRKVETYYYYLEYQRERKKQGYHFEDERSLNMVITGNPGTGKTTIARMLARIYHELGALPREEVLEVDRSHLVGAYVGQTEEKTMNVIEQAVGGVLFIDEAYSLKREGAGGADYGQTVIDTLVAAMTSGEYAGRFAVILAGYPEEMRRFLWSNPGLRSRFPETNHIHLPDFSMDELIEIAEHVALDNDFTLTDEAIRRLKNHIEKERVDESFGNARAVKNLVLEAIFYKGAEAAKEKNYSRHMLTVLDEHAFSFDDDRSSGNEQTAWTELDRLIGLTEVKEEVKKLSSFVRIQQERDQKGLPSIPIQLHAVFSGPPGTGKTTVAKLYSRILYELGLLKRGHLVVTGRSDLVAGYVGQTALKTKQKIREALGGVLFIDEAYALLEGPGTEGFGKEAIDTLVEEMTKHDENLIVILAGYEQPIQQLLASNPGLSSRFKKFITFPSYNVNELGEIITFFTEDYGYELQPGTLEALINYMEQAPPEGNARAMKDWTEEAIQRQAYRLVHQQYSDDDLTVLKKEDFLLTE